MNKTLLRWPQAKKKLKKKGIFATMGIKTLRTNSTFAINTSLRSNQKIAKKLFIPPHSTKFIHLQNM